MVITGTVRGTGFRPLVYRLASEYPLIGWMEDSDEGICVVLEGTEEAIARTIAKFYSSNPPTLLIKDVELRRMASSLSRPFVHADGAFKALNDRGEEANSPAITHSGANSLANIRPDLGRRVNDSTTMAFRGRRRVSTPDREYATSPLPILSGSQGATTLGWGVDTGNSICILHEANAFLSQPVGNIAAPEAREEARRAAQEFIRLLRIKPNVMACDLDPRCNSTIMAKEEAKKADYPLFEVQHQHAHVAGAMAENGLTGEAIGVVFDDAGYGTDGGIWGGEFLLANAAEFYRLAHFQYVPMPGGGKAIREPWRMAMSYLRVCGFSENEIDEILFKTAAGANTPTQHSGYGDWKIAYRACEAGINSPPTSSVGRLFDAIAAILGIRRKIAYDGQAALELESYAERWNRKSHAVDNSLSKSIWRFSIDTTVFPWVIKPAPLIKTIAERVSYKSKCATIEDEAPRLAFQFHVALSELILKVCDLLVKEGYPDSIVLSGTIFQNHLLFELTCSALERKGYKVYSNWRSPINDGGVALGQAVIARALMKH